MPTAEIKDLPPAYAETVKEITRIYRSLPPRPSIEEVAAAFSVIQTVETEHNLHLEDISKQTPTKDVPPELFSILQEVKKVKVSLQSHEQRKEAAPLVELDRIFQVFDGFIQKASELVSKDVLLEELPDLGGGGGEVEIPPMIGEEKSVESAQGSYPTCSYSEAALLSSVMATSEIKDPPPNCAETVKEITEIYKSMLPRPSFEEVAAAMSVLQAVETEQKLRLEEISKQTPSKDVPLELFSILQEVKKAKVSFQSHEQRKEAEQMVELDVILKVFDGLIQKASELVPKDVLLEELPDLGEVEIRPMIGEGKSVDSAKGFYPISSSSETAVLSSGGEVEKYDVLKLTAVIENSAKAKARILNLQSKLMEKVEWLPLSLGKLSNLTELYLSENKIMALPNSISSLESLLKFDIHGNQLFNLPKSFGELQNLVDLDFSGNLLRSLPESFGNLNNLINLDLSLNRFTNLPSIVGDLTSLQRLNLEANDLEELPHTIGLCSSLVELRLEFNKLKALPEAIGNLERLEILSLHYNRVKTLPSTMGSLSCLIELNVSFNELESIPETFCFALSLKKLNVGKNFTDLRTLPESLGKLEMLEELDISYNQIKTLPDSFRFLSRLRSFYADQTPFEVPPMQITKLGAQAIIQYMDDLVAERNEKSQERKKKGGLCSYIFPVFCFGTGKE